MLMRKAILGACLILLVSAAHADDDEYKCQLKLIEAESLFNQKTNEKLLSEKAIEDINLFLDEADEACIQGDQKGVNEALDKVNELVSSATNSGQKDQ